MPTGPKPRPEAERFWAKVSVRGPDECWLWTGGTSNGGYGAFRLGSLTDGSRRQVNASQWVCEQSVGRPLRRGEMACHHCDNKPCCNPRHIYLGNARTNGRDAAERGRLRPAPRLGESNPNAKLTEQEVRAILAAKERSAELARRYGVSETQIGWIRAGKSWGHLNGNLHVQ